MSKSLWKYIFGLALLITVIWAANPYELIQVFSTLSIPMVLLLLGISVVLIYISALKWGLFISNLGSKISTFRLFKLYLVGYFVNLILPSYLGGDAVRSYQIGKDVGQHNAAAATILERYTGLLAMVLLGCVSIFIFNNTPLQIKLGVLFVTIGVIIVTFLAISNKSITWLSKIQYTKVIIPHIEKLHSAISSSLMSPSLAISAGLLSLLYHSVTVVNTYVCAMAVGWESVPVFGLFVVLPLILLIGALPISPNGLGLQEGAFYYFLSSIGATPAQALGIALILRAKSYVIAIFGGIVWIFEPKVSRDSRSTKIFDFH